MTLEKNRLCRACGKMRPIEHFYQRKQIRNGRAYTLYTCKERVKAASKNYKKDNAETCRQTGRRSNLKRRYGLTPEDIEKMSAAQQGCCAGCAEPFDEKINVDHDHTTTKVRGLLCTRCNLVLGKV